MKKLIFPQDFKKINHKVVPGAFQWLPKNETSVFISIVGGGFGLYGNGKTTFEIMKGNDVEGYLNRDEINAMLEDVTVS